MSLVFGGSAWTEMQMLNAFHLLLHDIVQLLIKRLAELNTLLFHLMLNLRDFGLKSSLGSVDMLQVLFKLGDPFLDGCWHHGCILFRPVLAKLLFHVGLNGCDLCIAKRCLGHCWQMALWLGMCGWLPGVILDPWINFIGFFVFQAVQRSSWCDDGKNFWLAVFFDRGELCDEDVRVGHAVVDPVRGVFNCLNGPNNSCRVWSSPSGLHWPSIPIPALEDFRHCLFGAGKWQRAKCVKGFRLTK